MADRCPRCAALVRADAAWCGLCHADLRPAPPPEPDPAGPPSVVTEPATAVPPTAASMSATEGRVDPDELLALLVAAGGSGASAAPPTARRRGRHARPDPEGADLAVTGLLPAPEASAVVETGPLAGVDLSVLATPASDPVSAWSRRLQAPGAKVAVMVGGVAIVGVLGLLMLTLAGLVLG